jgi:6-pyruvoyltetrahydropterin/6-carboxytetrahydropterin synthase
VIKTMKQYIYVDGWKANLRFSSAHIIPEYDKCGRLHGHTYAVHTKIVGTPDENGIIIDFSLLKKTLRDLVSYLDHKVLIPANHPNVTVKKTTETIQLTSLGKSYQFPTSDCLLLPIKSTSAEHLSLYILEEVVKTFRSIKNITEIEVGVDEGFGQGARISKEL